MSTAPRPQQGSAVRPAQAARAAPRAPQQLLTSSAEQSTPVKVIVPGRKRVSVKEEPDDSPPVLFKQRKYQQHLDERPRRAQIPTQKAKEAARDSYDAHLSNFAPDRSFGYEVEEEDFDLYYDQLPPRLQNVRSPPKMNRSHYSPSPIRPNRNPFSIVSMGKAVVTGRKEVLNQPIDVPQLIERYVNSESKQETEAWLINIGLCEKLNSMSRDYERMKAEMSELKKFVLDNRGVKREMKIDKKHIQNPWPGELVECTSTPFGANPAPSPPHEGDYVIPPIYCKKAMDCRDVYNSMQRLGKRRPGHAFLTHYVRELFSIVIEPPYRNQLTIRMRKRNDSYNQMSEEFIKPIEDFFLAVCDVPSGFYYVMGGVIREALAHELREIRRNPRKTRVEGKMLDVLKGFGVGVPMYMDDENAGLHSVERVEEIGEDVEEEEVVHMEMEDEEEDEDEDDHVHVDDH